MKIEAASDTVLFISSQHTQTELDEDRGIYKT